MSNKLQDLTLRVVEIDHLVLRVVKTGWDRYGMTCTVQTDTKTMLSKPSKVLVDYLIKYDNGNLIYPAIKDVQQLLKSNKFGKLTIGNETKDLSEWKKDINYANSLMKELSRDE